jgi:hypothetical protein
MSKESGGMNGLFAKKYKIVSKITKRKRHWTCFREKCIDLDTKGPGIIHKCPEGDRTPTQAGKPEQIMLGIDRQRRYNEYRTAKTIHHSIAFAAGRQV